MAEQVRVHVWTILFPYLLVYCLALGVMISDHAFFIFCAGIGKLCLNVCLTSYVKTLLYVWPFRDQRDGCPTYKESFQVRWDNSIPLFLHASIYLEVSLFRWTSQNAFSHVQMILCAMLHAALHTAVSRENTFWLVQRNRDTSRYMEAWRKSGILLSQRTWKDSL